MWSLTIWHKDEPKVAAKASESVEADVTMTTVRFYLALNTVHQAIKWQSNMWQLFSSFTSALLQWYEMSYHRLCRHQDLQAAVWAQTCHQTWATWSSSPCLSRLTNPRWHYCSVNMQHLLRRMSPITTTVCHYKVQKCNSHTMPSIFQWVFKDLEWIINQILPFVTPNQHLNKNRSICIW